MAHDRPDVRAISPQLDLYLQHLSWILDGQDGLEPHLRGAQWCPWCRNHCAWTIFPGVLTGSNTRRAQLVCQRSEGTLFAAVTDERTKRVVEYAAITHPRAATPGRNPDEDWTPVFSPVLSSSAPSPARVQDAEDLASWVLACALEAESAPDPESDDDSLLSFGPEHVTGPL